MKNRVIYILFSISLFYSCKSIRPFFIKNEKKENRKEKKIIKKNPSVIKSDTIDIVKRDTIKVYVPDTNLAKSLIRHNTLSYNTISFTARMHFESEKEKQNFNAGFRLEKDKKIWVSIYAPVIGEVARALITPDSVWAMEKLNKNAYEYAYADLQKLVNVDVDFYSLQNIIVANPFAVTGVITDLVSLPLLKTVEVKNNEISNQLSFNINDSTMKQQHVITTRASANSTILVSYAKYAFMDNVKRPTEITFHIQDLKGAAYLEMSINKMEINKPLEFPYKVPAKYKFVKK